MRITRSITCPNVWIALVADRAGVGKGRGWNLHGNRAGNQGFDRSLTGGTDELFAFPTISRAAEDDELRDRTAAHELPGDMLLGVGVDVGIGDATEATPAGEGGENALLHGDAAGAPFCTHQDQQGAVFCFGITESRLIGGLSEFGIGGKEGCGEENETGKGGHEIFLVGAERGRDLTGWKQLHVEGIVP